MGYNSTLIVLNDALDCIKKDADFGRKVHDAVLTVGREGQVDIASNGHCNAAAVVETHHADYMKLVAVGGNRAVDLGYVGSYRDEPEQMLRTWAERLGYRLVRKPKGK